MSDFPEYKTFSVSNLIPYARNSRTHSTARGAHSGELHHSSKLTVDAVIELRNRVRCGDRFMDVVNDMGIKKLTGYDACTGKTWRTVDSQSMPVNIKDAARATA
jgi:hypothetical protein